MKYSTKNVIRVVYLENDTVAAVAEGCPNDD